jgi:hypothetical protein
VTEHLPEGHDCLGLAECVWAYPDFDSNPADYGLLPEKPLTEAQLRDLEMEAGL